MATFFFGYTLQREPQVRRKREVLTGSELKLCSCSKVTSNLRNFSEQKTNKQETKVSWNCRFWAAFGGNMTKMKEDLRDVTKQRKSTMGEMNVEVVRKSADLFACFTIMSVSLSTFM